MYIHINRNLGKYQLPHIWHKVTGHTITQAQITQLYHPSPYIGKLPHMYTYNKWGAHTTSFGKYCPTGCLPSPYHPYYLRKTPYNWSTKTTQTPYTPISVVPSLVSTRFYLCSLTFCHRPDAVASVWMLQKLVCHKLIICFVSAYGRYYNIACLLKLFEI